MDGLRGRGSSSIWHHGELKYRRTSPWGLVQHSMRRGLQVYGRVGGGKRKEERGVRKATGQAEEERRERTRLRLHLG